MAHGIWRLILVLIFMLDLEPFVLSVLSYGVDMFQNETENVL